ncbi:MAG TPA: hypothetical protein PJ986_09295 [Gammaproteobacteria bacterium]|nr:hypothetical protein [Gammaproteobacteria bacterium]
MSVATVDRPLGQAVSEGLVPGILALAVTGTGPKSRLSLVDIEGIPGCRAAACTIPSSGSIRCAN